MYKLLNVQLLKSKMTLYNDTQEDLAEYLGVARYTLFNKFNEKSYFTNKEIYLIKIRYDLTDEEVILIFFTLQVTQNAK